MLLLILACVPSPADSTPNPGDTSDTSDSGSSDTASSSLVYASGDGPFAVTATAQTMGGAATDLYTPNGDGPFPVVLWAHGFFRKKEQHIEAARHAASWGFIVAAPDLPELSDHEKNAEYLANDLLPEVQALPSAGTQVAMVGHSAGGLATLLASGIAGADIWVGLDPVDASSLGAAGDQDVSGASLLLHGEPGTCNSSGSAYGWKTAGEQWTVTVTDADHCDFESNTDGTCTSFCGEEDPERQTLIQVYAVAWLVAHTGGDASGWLAGGEAAQADRAAGRLSW